MSRHIAFYELRDALAQPGCPLCRLETRVAERYLDFLLWERVNDPELRQNLRQARGFCREHAWMLVRPGASLGIAVMLHDVLQDVLQSLNGAVMQPTQETRRPLERLRTTIAPAPPPAVAGIVAALEPQGEQICPACAQCRVMEEVYLDVLLDSLPEAGGLLEAYQSSDGLCLPHFRRAVQRVRTQRVLDALLHAQRTVWERLRYQLGEVIRKNDYRFHDEPWGEEADAWLRVIEALVGAAPTQPEVPGRVRGEDGYERTRR